MLAIIWLHFIADFICQWDEMALKKSESYYWLILHGLIYSLPFLWFGFLFWIINFVLHTIIDGLTSRVNKILYEKHRHWFFVNIGFDQALHMTCLYLTYNYLRV